MKNDLFVNIIICAELCIALSYKNQPVISPMITIKKTNDFVVTGNGSAASWTKSDWTELSFLRGEGKKYETKAKLLYSEKGIYGLFFCRDERLNATLTQDFADLWKEDVIEAFFQPDGKKPAYFEYELSPLGYELPLIVFNEKGKLNSWIPFHYEDIRRTRHATSIEGGVKKAYAAVNSWTAEFFIPFALMKPVLTTFPTKGVVWKGNLYRIDYDHGEALWAWKKNNGNFHNYENFGEFHFE